VRGGGVAVRRVLWLSVCVALAVAVGCYAHGPKPPPCVNVENCGEPTDYPALTDDSPINLAGAHAPDAGTRG
jgi:hypothetical protein